MKKPLHQEGPDELVFALWLFLRGLFASLLIQVLIKHDSALILFGCLFSFLFTGCHGLIAPIIGALYKIGPSLSIVASHVIGLAAIEEVHIRHGVIIILPLINSGLKHLHAFVNCSFILGLQLVAPFLAAFALQLVIHLHAV